VIAGVIGLVGITHDHGEDRRFDRHDWIDAAADGDGCQAAADQRRGEQARHE
jgi:hypothetical protein